MYFDIETRTIYRELSDIPSDKRRDIFHSSAFIIEDAEIVTKAFPDYMVTDQGQKVTPRYGVIRTPVVGDRVGIFVGMGNTQEEGEIKSISQSLKVITLLSGEKFYRQKASKFWKSKDRTLSLKLYSD